MNRGSGNSQNGSYNTLTENLMLEVENQNHLSLWSYGHQKWTKRPWL